MAEVIIDKISNGLGSFFDGKQYSKIVVLVDEHTKKFCYPIIKSYLPSHNLITIKSGEQNKTLVTCQSIWEQMTNFELDRHALLVNIGGGVIGDMGGFCAATYKRGIDFIQIPTTLLSQVDASIGGKLGIDFLGFKNHIGVFSIPKAVLIDAFFLQTLPKNELRSGFAEIIKHCLIRDKNKWNEIKVKDLIIQDLEDLIRHSVEIKKAVVDEDPTEKGLRKILNFGHTLGHAMETFYLDKGKKRLLHGEAIAAGMIMESYLAFEKKMIEEKTFLDIEEFLFTVYGRVEIEEIDFGKIIDLTHQDKKNKGKIVRASILDGIGSCQFDISLSRKEMLRAMKYYTGI